MDAVVRFYVQGVNTIFSDASGAGRGVLSEPQPFYPPPPPSCYAATHSTSSRGNGAPLRIVYDEREWR